MAALMLFGASSAVAQSIVTGKVVDENNLPMVGATVVVPGTSTGTSVDVDGTFTLRTNAGDKRIEIAFIGYDSEFRDIKTGNNDLGTIQLKAGALAMESVIVQQSMAVQRKTPVAVATVNAEDIEFKLGSQEFAEALKSVPGVYSTKGGGGYGDTETRVRGFKAANVAMMVNGIPVNDMEWGGVYWSNWGLSEIVRSTQVQRGLGASKISSPSVGGSINIVTKGIEAKRGGSASFGIGNHGEYSLSMSLSTGLTEKGWSLTVLGAKKWGDGYIQGTQFDSYAWFVNVSKRINDRHQLSLTAFGSPQEHFQRKLLYAGLKIEDWKKAAVYMGGEQNMYRYNPAYGFDRYGRQRTSQFNHYHKPQIALNHQWQIDHKSSLSTALYMSIGRGGGYSGQGRTSSDRSNWNPVYSGTVNTEFLNPDGTYAYDKVQAINAASTDGSRMIMADSQNKHMWYGAISTYTNQVTPSLEFSAGIDVRYYVGTHVNYITDLYDGAYFIDDNSRSSVKAANNAAAADPNWQYEKLSVGDVVYRDYDSHLHSEGFFAQLEYSKNKWNAFLSGSVSNQGVWRYDRFYYDAAHAESPHYNYFGYTVKGGVNYNVTRRSNFFANIGYFSRAPFFSRGVFLANEVSNAVNPDSKNEQTFSVELGYGYRSEYFSADINGYYTLWMNKTDASTVKSVTLNGGLDYGRLNLLGVDARHMGIEANFTVKPTKWLDINGMVSIGDWIQNSNSRGYLFDSAGQPLKDTSGTLASGVMAEDHAYIDLIQKGVKVGGSAQTTAALGITVRPIKGLRLSADWNIYADHYADPYLSMNSVEINKAAVVQDPWKIPWGNEVGLSGSYSFNLGKNRATIYCNIHNLFNYYYITEAQYAATDPGIWQNTYAVMYSLGRRMSVRLKINF